MIGRIGSRWMSLARANWLLPSSSIDSSALACFSAVSYTHLDVYKRQAWSGLREGFSTNPRTFTAGVLGSVVRYSRRSRQRDPRVGNDLG